MATEWGNILKKQLMGDVPIGFGDEKDSFGQQNKPNNDNWSRMWVTTSMKKLLTRHIYLIFKVSSVAKM